MFGFIKKYLFTGMMLFGYNLSSVNPLKSISMNNQECKVRPEIVNVNSHESVFFFLLILKQVDPKVVIIISILHMQNYQFLMLLKTLIWKYSI